MEQEKSHYGQLKNFNLIITHRQSFRLSKGIPDGIPSVRAANQNHQVLAR